MDTSVDRSCGEKIKFPAEIDAIIRIRHMIRNGVINKWEMHAYKCDHCDFYHIGHADRKTQKFVQSFVKNKKPSSPLIKMNK